MPENQILGLQVDVPTIRNFEKLQFYNEITLFSPVFSPFLVGKESFAAFYYILYILHDILHMLELSGIVNSKNIFFCENCGKREKTSCFTSKIAVFQNFL